jgi:hypothetical protein
MEIDQRQRRKAGTEISIRHADQYLEFVSNEESKNSEYFKTIFTCTESTD